MTAERPGSAAMRRQPSGAEESARLSALRSYCVLDTGREARFDDLTCLAASICETPMSLVSLVDTNRLFFKSAHGMDVRELPYPDFFCGHAIRQRDLFIVPDAMQDARFASHPLVVDAPRVRFYAGAPLITPQDYTLGTLFVVDFVPRELNAKQLETLRILARQAMCQLELNLQAMRDPLTGLYNRRQLEESLHREVLRARRIGAQDDRAGEHPGGRGGAQADRFDRTGELSLVRRFRPGGAARRGRRALQGESRGQEPGSHVHAEQRAHVGGGESGLESFSSFESFVRSAGEIAPGRFDARFQHRCGGESNG